MQLPFRITVCGLDELSKHSNTRVSHVLSILDPEWPAPEVFGTFGEHDKLELRFHDVLEDGPYVAAPKASHVEQLLAFGRRLDEVSGQTQSWASTLISPASRMSSGSCSSLRSR